MGIVESQQPPAVRTVQRERVGQAMRPGLRCGHLPDRELHPAAALEMMLAPVESEQEFEGMFGCGLLHIISGDDMIWKGLSQCRESAASLVMAGLVPAIHAFSGAALEATQRRSFLLPYKRQFMPVEDDFIRELGLDPEDEARWRLNLTFRPLMPHGLNSNSGV